MTAVVGVTPTGRMLAPSSAFTNVVLPWLNSPTTTRWKRSASSFVHELLVDLGGERPFSQPQTLITSWTRSSTSSIDSPSAPSFAWRRYSALSEKWRSAMTRFGSHG
jgi:hypothetical protein